jgi:hypothetical protein
LIDAARPTSIAVSIEGDSSPRTYTRWGEAADFAEFLATQAP